MGEFDPAAHRLVPLRAFEELAVGDEFPIPSRTVGDANFGAFQAASADNHPIHYDEVYCRTHGHPGLVAHGFQVLLFTTAGAGLFPHVVGEALIGFIEQSSRFLRPVYLGDTVYPNLTIVGLEPQRSTGVVTLRSTVHKQDGALVLEGEQRYLLRLRGSGR